MQLSNNLKLGNMSVKFIIVFLPSASHNAYSTFSIDICRIKCKKEINNRNSELKIQIILTEPGL